MPFEAEDLIKQAIERYGNKIAVACSFGKDSIVVLHMALKYNPDIKVVFHNTGVEFPETIHYKKKIAEEWNLNLIETKPIKSFWQCVKEYGLPQVRASGKGSNVPMCCIYCKEKPAEKAYKEHGIIACITGLMAEESHQRRLLAARYDNNNDEYNNIKFCGQRYYARSQNLWKFHPIIYWKEKDVFDYIEKHQIPLNPVYTKWNGIYKRCGCLPCTAYLGWERKLSKAYPKLYLKLKKIQDPEQETLKKFTK